MINTRAYQIITRVIYQIGIITGKCKRILKITITGTGKFNMDDSGMKLFLSDGTEVDEDDLLMEDIVKGEELIMALAFAEPMPSTPKTRPKLPCMTATPTSSDSDFSIGSNIEDTCKFISSLAHVVVCADKIICVLC